jgi:hypothetical protein
MAWKMISLSFKNIFIICIDIAQDKITLIFDVILFTTQDGQPSEGAVVFFALSLFLPLAPPFAEG